MEVAGIQAARWVLNKALNPVSSGALEAWAASTDIGDNIEALKMELLYAQGMLHNARSRGRDQEIQNPALSELLQKLRDLAYRADDVLDEVDYFRIQDELDGTYHAANEHEGGCLRNQALNARHTARTIAKTLGFSKCSRGAARQDKQEEETRAVSCGASYPCLGLTAPPDEEEQDDARSRGALCGAVWPCGGASATPPVTPAPGQHSDHQEVGDGCVSKLASTARDIIHSVGKHLPCSHASSLQNDATTNTTASSSARRGLLSCGRHNKAPERKRIVKSPKLKFDRVEASQKIKEITEQLKPVCAKVSTILNLELLDANRSIAHCIATNLDARFSGKKFYTTLPRNAISRPITTSESVQKEIYGRKGETNNIIFNITEGEYRHNDLTILPIVGPGGIGKTTLIQHIYNDEKVQAHFDIKLWVCVSINNFSVYRLTQEVADKLKNDKKDSPDKLIAEMLTTKRFLLVLDDMWSCSNEDEREKFLLPFKKGQTQGNVIMVTTRIPGLAQIVKTTEQYIDLKGLDLEDFTKLFFAWIFGDEQPLNDQRELLLDIGNQIKEKLKGSPLAAKTVGRLLRSHIDLDHWTRVLESKQWEFQNGENDIMPALKLSFDYLPFHLQQCFVYCALFPEDYKFGKQELIHFWIGLDVLHSHGENKSIEEIGHTRLTELTYHGFFKKEEDGEGNNFYIIHDLLHELAVKISAHECLSIYSSNVRLVEIPPSIHHLSIHFNDTSVKDRKTFDACKEDFIGLGKRLKVENLHSLMLFGSYQESFVKIFAAIFSKAKALRVIFLSGSLYYSVEDLLPNFSELVHLRYLRTSCFPPPNCISRSYHLRILDIKLCLKWDDIPRDMGNLGKLRHFIAAQDKMHADLYKVGGLKSIQELKRFVVKKEAEDFELREIGKLLELRGSLWISNLERVVVHEAEEAKLAYKTHLRKLVLEWDVIRSNRNPAREEQVLECLKPSSNLLELSIIGHGGVTCPSWLRVNLLTKHLESLQLNKVSWRIFPPIGELWLVNEQGEEHYSSNISNSNFQNLKRIKLTNLEGLRKWVVDSTSQLFFELEVLHIEDCPKLEELSFSVSRCSEQEENMTWFPKLRQLVISNCPKFSYIPRVPWTHAPCSIRINGSGLLGLNYLTIEGNDAQLWTVMDFDNLTEVTGLNMRCPPMQLDHLQKLSCLKTINMSNLDNPFCPVEDEGSSVHYQLPCEFITMYGIGASGKELTQVLSYMPKLSVLDISECEKITGLDVAWQQIKASSSSSQVEAIIGHQRQQQNSKEEEIAEGLFMLPRQLQVLDNSNEEELEEGLLLLPPQIQVLQVYSLPNLVLGPYSVDDVEGGGKGRGLQGLCSLRTLVIRGCPKFFSSYFSSSSFCFPFPPSLQRLILNGVEGMEMLTPLSNLTSLTELEIWEGGDLRGEGIWCLLAQGCLTQLTVSNTPNFFSGSAPPELNEQQGSSFGSSKLQSLWMKDGVPGFLDVRICSFLSSSLTKLKLHGDDTIERFTEQQDEALQLLTSLTELNLRYWSKLRYLPAGLNTLPNLKKLSIRYCPAIRSLSNLPHSLQTLEIRKCPSIQVLPKGGLPRSLLVLYVQQMNSEELRKQCRKLTGTIPIVWMT